MASLIQDFEYDIFISYRQKDNKGDRWVSEFVDALKDELESTFKEEISVYFDINPHNGLLETHDVYASLKDKLKCLVFIPVISRTYCDPKSFAWENEFKEFIEQASHDQHGLKVSLQNGNVANRVLPVLIHDLDINDIELFESILGGVLRGVEFIYKESGFNRPLKPDDDEKINLNKTKYRNQITKVTLAIKEIILGLQDDTIIPVPESVKPEISFGETGNIEKSNYKKNPAGLKRIKILSVSGVLSAIIIAALIAFPKILKQDKLENLRSPDGRISVAIMPFQNMTNDTIWDVWQDGIQNELIASLTNSEELRVRQTESITGLLQSRGFINYASITPAVASSISQKLDANVFIYGSIKQAGAVIRVSAQLMDTKTELAFKSFQIDGNAENILHIIDSLSVMVRNFLVISKLEKEIPREEKNIASTDSPEAYRFYIYGMKAISRKDYPDAVKLFSQAIAIDSNFISAINSIAFAYGLQSLFEPAKVWSLKSYNKRDQMTMQEKITTNWTYAYFFETPYEAIKYLRQLQEIDDQLPNWYSDIGFMYLKLYQYDKAIPELEKALEIYSSWDSKPWWVLNYTELGYAYHKTGQYDKEQKLYRRAAEYFPDDPDLVYLQTILSLGKGEMIESKRLVEKYISVCKENTSSDETILLGLGNLYSEAGIPDKAEEYYRQALSIQPENPDIINNLAWFLIDKGLNINEGLKLTDRALKLSPDDFYINDTKGWGLYKLGKYKEAMEILEKNWKVRPIYNHEAYLHLRQAEKAVPIQ
jgi:tetratricopeptide (TPR) repeat protein